MFNLLGQPKAIILIISEYDVQMFVWEERTLIHQSQFSSTPADHVHFEQNLQEFLDYPLIIVTDFLEESFRHETVAHVSGNDRKALLERKLNYAFRNTPYRIAKVTGRETEGRKDDRILLSALTKPELLRPWVEVLLKHKIAIQSITSVAFLMEIYVQNTGMAGEKHLLVASIEKGMNLRQTYLGNGRVLFSRLTTLSPKDLSALGDDIYHESLQIRKYLERIKFLPYEQTLRVQVFSPYDSRKLLIESKSSDLTTFESIDIRNEEKVYSFALGDQDIGATILFLANILQKKQVGNVYAPPTARKYFQIKTLSRALAFSSFLVILAAVGLKATPLLETLDRWKQQQDVDVKTAPLLANYENLTRRFPETPIPSKEMALVVETYERIKEQSYMPEQAMSMISRALASSPNLEITEINWALEQTAADPSNPNYLYSAQPLNNPGDDYTYAILDHRTILKVSVSGIALSPSSFREAQDQVLTFSNALDAFDGVSVNPVKMPTDVRLDTKVTTTVGDEELRAPFTLELTLGAS